MDSRMNEAERLFDKGNFARATEIYTQLLEETPKNWKARYYLGVVWQRLELDAQAVDAFNRAIEDMPADAKESGRPGPSLAMACFYRGISLILIGQQEQAIASLTLASQIVPRDLRGPAFQLLFLSKFYLGDVDGAIASGIKSINYGLTLFLPGIMHDPLLLEKLALAMNYLQQEKGISLEKIAKIKELLQKLGISGAFDS